MGTPTSFVKPRVAVGAEFPAASVGFAVIEIAPSAAPLKSRFALHAPAVQVTVADAEPVMTTLRPLSVHVPVTGNAETFAAVPYAPAAGVAIATAGAVASLTKDREAWAAPLPDASVWSA